MKIHMWHLENDQGGCDEITQDDWKKVWELADKGPVVFNHVRVLMSYADYVDLNAQNHRATQRHLTNWE